MMMFGDKIVTLAMLVLLVVADDDVGEPLIEKYICEHKGSSTIQCAANQYIHIAYAMYGRLERNRCETRNVPKNPCKATNSLAITKQKCGNKKQSCSLTATNNWYGDPCRGIQKYLHVKYQCLSIFDTYFNKHPVSAGNFTLGNSVRLKDCVFFDTTGTSFNASWIKDGKEIASNVPITDDGNNKFAIASFRIELATVKDEGLYKCGLKADGEIKVVSQEIQLVFNDVVRVSFTLVLSSPTPVLEIRKRREINNSTIEDVIKELQQSILISSPVNEVRIVKKSDLELEIIIATIKRSSYSEQALFDQYKYLSRIQNIGSIKVNLLNYDYCASEMIGNPSFKGEYKYQSSTIATIVRKICVHGSMNVKLDSFVRICQKIERQAPKWSTPDLSHCLAETKTTQGLINLSSNTICTRAGQKNCQSVETVSQNLSSVVTSAAVVSIPEDVTLVSGIVKNIANSLQNVNTINETAEILSNVLDVTSSISDVSPEVLTVADDTAQASENLRESLDKIADHSTRQISNGDQFLISKKNIGFLATRTKRQNLRLTSTISNTNTLATSINSDQQVTTANFLAEMEIPDSTFEQNIDITLFSYAFRNDALFKNAKLKTGSSILSATINNKKLQNLTTPIQIRFKVSNSATGLNPDCSFWDENANLWSTNGVNTSQFSSGEMTLCKTSHLTNFALILDVSQTKRNPLALQLITWIGCGISLGGLLLTVISYSAFRRLRRKLVPKLLICLSLSLICTLIIFLIGVEKTGSRLGCQIVAGLLHYFLLVTFSWMAVQGANLYRSLVQIFNSNISDSQFFFRSFIVCTGVPAIIVTITGGLRSHEYGSDTICVVQGLSFFVTLLTPVCLILIGNLVMLVLVIRAVKNAHSNMKASKGGDDQQNPLKLAKITIACSILLGLTWLFGVLAVGELTSVMQYLFCIFNSLQGFFIFVFYTLTNEEVRKEWKNAVGLEFISSTFSQTTMMKKRSTANVQAKKQRESVASMSNISRPLHGPPPPIPADQQRYSNGNAKFGKINLNIRGGISNAYYEAD